MIGGLSFNNTTPTTGYFMNQDGATTEWFDEWTLTKTSAGFPTIATRRIDIGRDDIAAVGNFCSATMTGSISTSLPSTVCTVQVPNRSAFVMKRRKTGSNYEYARSLAAVAFSESVATATDGRRFMTGRYFGQVALLTTATMTSAPPVFTSAVGGYDAYVIGFAP